MHFLIWETLSFNLIYVAACYLVGTGMCHNMVGLLQHYVRLMDSAVTVLNTLSFYVYTKGLHTQCMLNLIKPSVG